MDYQELGLRVGLELHQQLDSGHKLFCNCPITKSADFPKQIERRLRPAAGELDIVDPAAIYEFLRNKKFLYSYNLESSCLLELDEKPPDPINTKALETVLKISKMLNASVMDEVHVMRKTVIDGSSVSGFQRTALISMNGHVDTSFGKVGIRTISLEEDSSTALKKGKDFVEYRLDRLGIPLVEIATSAEMHTPMQAKEVASLIGTLLRSFSVVRGIGSIRQDVNISIERGARIEVKGFQELDKIPKIVENEVQRQLSLIEIKEELHKRGLKEEELKMKPIDITDIFEKTTTNFILKIVKEGGKVFAIKLPKFADLLRKGCGDRTFGKELAGYVEAFGFAGIVHSDENLEKYKLLDEFVLLEKRLHVKERDVVVILVGENEENIVRALNKILERAAECLNGVPEETRVADGIGSKYTRPLPGSGRMYPESDIPAIRIDRKYLDKLELPKTRFEIEKELGKELTKEMAHQISKSKYYQNFVEFQNFGAAMVATTFLSTFTDLRRRGFDIEKITKDHMFKIFSLAQKNQIPKSSLPAVFEALASGKDIDTVIASYSSLSEKEVEAIVKKVVDENKDKKESVIMGLVMKEVRGRADGSLVAKLVKKRL